MGHIITLEDQGGMYKFECPSLPKETDIWYYDLPKSQQYWRTPHNKNFKWLNPKGELWDVRKMPEREKIEYVEYWRDKWEHGLWFMNNGVPTYITGMHVDHLVFNKFKNGFFYYLESQKERFYFREITNNEVNCDGRCWAKGRRVGITSEEVTESIRVLLSDYSNHVNLQSDTFPKAKSTLLDKIIEAYTRRPIWMREVFYSSNGKVPRSALELTEVTVRSDDDYPLGGKCRAFPTTVKAKDGEEAMLDVMDEFSKWVDLSPYETFEVNKKTIVNPGKRGKQDCLSTSGDGKESQKALKDWHKLIHDSNPKVLNQNGQTNSGLWVYMVSYIHSLELLERIPQIKDIHGRINREMAEEYIWNDIKKYPKDSKEYVYALYKQPMELRHVLLTISGQGYFSKIRITHRLDQLRSLPNDRKPYIRGNFKEDQKGKVYFEADEIGHWLVALHPYFSAEKNIDTRNRYKKVNGVFYPPINPEFGIGYDPIRYRKEDTSSNNLSEAAIIVYKKFDYYNSGEQNRYAALYLHRPDDPRDAHKECIKACKYFGAPAAHERTIETVKEDFDDANCLPFLIKNPKDNLYGFWVDAQGKLVKNALDTMVTRFSIPQSEEDIDQIAEMPFEDVLVDLDGIDISNTTKFDTFMAMVELEHCLKQIVFTNLVDSTQKTNIKWMNEMIPARK